MSVEREIRRFANRKKAKEERKRTTCKRCKSQMLEKPGYGLVCAECGWEPRKNTEES